LGRSLLEPIETLSKWATVNQPKIQASRAAYDTQAEAAE
jgi:hypothetical protein